MQQRSAWAVAAIPTAERCCEQGENPQHPGGGTVRIPNFGYKAGGVFGELAMLGGPTSVRQASIVATTPVSCASIAAASSDPCWWADCGMLVCRLGD